MDSEERSPFSGPMYKNLRPPFLDNGTCPEYLATALYRIEVMPFAMFRAVYYVERVMDGEKVWIPPVSIVQPIAAVAHNLRVAQAALAGQVNLPREWFTPGGH